MKKNFFNSYVFDELTSVEKNLGDFIITKDPENLHRLRVKIKKIKAIFSMAEKVGKSHYSTGELDRVFKDAGKIREVQINSILLLKFTFPPKSLISSLKKKEEILIRKFIKDAPLFIESLSKFREQINLPKKIETKKTIRKYFEKQKSKANSFMEHGNKIDLHRYRKKLKQIMFVYDSLPVHLQQDIEIDKEQIERLQQKLGEWHDFYATVNFISHMMLPKRFIKSISELKVKEQHLYEGLCSDLQNL